MKIGIDAGGALIKIAYYENDILRVKTFSIREWKQVTQWLTILPPDALLHITGGRGALLQRQMQQQSYLIDEFQSLVDGVRFLIKQEKAIPLDEEVILVSVGTSTSIFHLTSDAYVRLLGSGIGGGTLMGLGTIISGNGSFRSIIEQAAKGNNKASDLLIKDIDSSKNTSFVGEWTAANFGKVYEADRASTNDYMASLIQMIGETIVTFAVQAAITHHIHKILFVGSTLNSNEPLKKVLTSFQPMLSNRSFWKKGHMRERSVHY